MATGSIVVSQEATFIYIYCPPFNKLNRAILNTRKVLVKIPKDTSIGWKTQINCIGCSENLVLSPLCTILKNYNNQKIIRHL